MAELACLDRDFAYGYLIQEKANPATYRIGVFKASRDLWGQDECLFWGVVDGVTVIEKHVADVKVPDSVWRPTWRDILRAIFRW